MGTVEHSYVCICAHVMYGCVGGGGGGGGAGAWCIQLGLLLSAFIGVHSFFWECFFEWLCYVSYNNSFHSSPPFLFPIPPPVPPPHPPPFLLPIPPPCSSVSILSVTEEMEEGEGEGGDHAVQEQSYELEFDIKRYIMRCVGRVCGEGVAGVWGGGWCS